MIKKILQGHKTLWPQKSFMLSVAAGILILAASLLLNYKANIFATSHASNYVSDVLLDNLPVLNVDFIFVDGFAVLWALILILLIKEPHKIPFTIKSIGVFILIRSIFITLTHLGMPPVRSYIEPNNLLGYISSGNDMFFSSHTGLPYLMALIFWNNIRLRIFFFFSSLFFAISVLLGHLHYSIDVFSAYFITYSIFQINKKIFFKDYGIASIRSPDTGPEPVA
jgi:hypothetical protein